ncbi:MAG: endolytic transglycosylase MltG [Eubacterium sp.]
MKVRLTKGEAKKEALKKEGSKKTEQPQNKTHNKSAKVRPSDIELKGHHQRQVHTDQESLNQPTRKKRSIEDLEKFVQENNSGTSKRKEQSAQSRQNRQNNQPKKASPKKKNGIKNKWILIVAGSIVLIFIMIFGGRSFYNAMLQPVGTNSESTIVEIPEGSTIKDVSGILYNEGLIKNTMIFESYAGRHSRGVSGVQAAEYDLNKAMSVEEIFTKLVNGDSYHGPLTTLIIPEGRNINEMAPLVEQSGICSAADFIAETKNLSKYKAKYAILGSIPDDKDRTLEGYLFPDTYHLKEKSKASDIVKAMLDRFVEVYDKKYQQDTKSVGKTVDEIVIMGSIIELETKLPEDKANASSVFYNRIAEGMPLQSDITVDYARGEKTPVLTEEQTKFESPYNTYINLGLPVGPICSPGITSIEAAIHPASTKYLFFVADMASGKLYFNETLEGHDQDVLKYMGQ